MKGRTALLWNRGAAIPTHHRVCLPGRPAVPHLRFYQGLVRWAQLIKSPATGLSGPVPSPPRGLSAQSSSPPVTRQFLGPPGTTSLAQQRPSCRSDVFEALCRALG